MVYKKEIIWIISKINGYISRIMVLIFSLLISAILTLLIPSINQKIIDDGFLISNFDNVLKYSKFMIIVIIIQLGITLVKEVIRVNLNADIRYKLFYSAFSKLLINKLEFFEQNTSTEVLNSIRYDLDNISRITQEEFFSPITQVFNMIGALIGLMFINVKLTLLIFLLVPIKYFVIKIFSKVRERLTQECIQANEEFSKWVGDSINGIKEIKAFNIYNYKKNQFSEKEKKVIILNKKFSLLDACNIVFDSTFIQIIMVIVYIISTDYILNLDITIGGIFAFITYSPYVVQPIYSILNIKYMLASIIPATKHFREFLDGDDELNWGETQFNYNLSITGKIEFLNVNFSYASKEVLSNINFTINSGEKVALIGSNGSGKSTIFNLILRFYEINSGNILVDGIDINKIEINLYRNLISLINQDIYLFNDTLKENITLHKDVDKELLKLVIKKSGLDKFVEEVGLDYIINSNGSNLSGGQKQKIAIARALINDSQIILFDEAVSNLDVESSKEIYSLINTTLKDKTVIVISHDLDILKIVDKIISLKDGQVNVYRSNRV